MAGLTLNSASGQCVLNGIGCETPNETQEGQAHCHGFVVDRRLRHVARRHEELVARLIEGSGASNQGLPVGNGRALDVGRNEREDFVCEE